MALQKKSLFFAPAAVIFCSLVGGMMGPGAGDVSAASQEDDVKNSLKTFSRVFDLVEQNAADKVDPDKTLYKGAIPGMLRTLDPHSNFFDPRDFQEMREGQRGQYYGVGMKVGSRENRTVVISPFVDSPAAGLRPGDLLMMVNGKDTLGLRTDEVADLLKGPKGTTAQVAVKRDGEKDYLSFSVIRDSIPRPSVPDAFWLKPGIMYLAIERFNETTSKEMEAHFKRLGEQNVKGLILDLRENPGGLLNEGIAVADHFLEKGQTIVSHRGRASAERSYAAPLQGNGGKNYPIVVVVNRNSASASEIVSGALQDHDRALVFGETTFGKGLVQSVFQLSENTGLALTTAKYYTPSGRLIQRDYSTTSFFDYYYKKGDTKNMQDVKMTDSGRTVYGGGGITPDDVFDTKLSTVQIGLVRNYAFLNFAAHYLAVHGRNLSKDFQANENTVAEFIDFLKKSEITYDQTDFNAHLDWIKAKIREELFINGFDVDQGRHAAIETDPMIIKAVEDLPKAKELEDNAKKMIVQRRSGN